MLTGSQYLPERGPPVKLAYREPPPDPERRMLFPLRRHLRE
jgi:hypothetical protein